MSELIRIYAPHFCAGVVISDEGTVTKAAPIVRYMSKWSKGRVLLYVEHKGWMADVYPAARSEDSK